MLVSVFLVQITKAGKSAKKGQKKAKKGRNDKTPAKSVTAHPHWKSGRKRYLEMDPITFLAKKCPKNAILPSWGLRLVRFWQSDGRFWKFRFFQYNKVVLVSGFLAKIKKRHFLTEKMAFFTFWCYLPFSMAFLSSLTSWFAPNFLNQVRKPDFGRNITLRLETLGKKGKIQKTVLPDTFFWFGNFFHTK